MIDRELLFRALQVAVVGPFIYKIADEQDSDYFRIGLKMVAGSMVLLNVKPLLTALTPMVRNAVDIYLQQNGYKKELKNTSVIDAEFREVNGSSARGKSN